MMNSPPLPLLRPRLELKSNVLFHLHTLISSAWCCCTDWALVTFDLSWSCLWRERAHTHTHTHTHTQYIFIQIFPELWISVSKTTVLVCWKLLPLLSGGASIFKIRRMIHRPVGDTAGSRGVRSLLLEYIDYTEHLAKHGGTNPLFV